MPFRIETKDDWVEKSLQENYLFFSELDVLLRALDRFCSPEQIDPSSENTASRNFYEELLTVRDGILRCLSILEIIIPDNRKNAYWFQKYAESKFLPKRKADALREGLYRQDSPEKSLFLLYDSFINLKGILTDLLRSGTISYLSFTNIGHVLTKEIRENVHFNPFKRDINPVFDTIANPEISKIVRKISDKDEKKIVSVIFLYLFRFLRMLSFIEITSRRSVSLNSSLLILILLRFEISTLRLHIDKSVGRLKSKDLKLLLQAVSYQFSMETKRVYTQELRDVLRKKASSQFRGKIENSHGILKNLTEHSVIQLSQYYDKTIQGEAVFASFMTKVEQSLRLREDIVALHRFMLLMETVADRPGSRIKLFESLKSYMMYFESFTFRLLRHDDYEEFNRFFHGFTSLTHDAMTGPQFDKLLERFRHFRIFLETTLQHIANRSELAGRPVDNERVENLISQYL